MRHKSTTNKVEIHSKQDARLELELELELELNTHLQQPLLSRACVVTKIDKIRLISFPRFTMGTVTKP